MKRRDLFKAAAAGLAMPSISRAQGSRTLRFIPQADLSILDPHLNTAYVTRNHGFMVYDTLYGLNGKYQVSGQMVAGHVVGDDGKRWTLTLRDGLRWHDGEPVLARDCVASIKRWGAKDTFGQTLLAATDELSAPDDRTILFRLKRPFPLLPDAFAKSGVYMPAMMPERLAKTDPSTPVTEIIGSGPFIWQADERVPGARAVWRRNERYVPVPTGTPDYLAGPKIVHLDRVVWTTTPDPATAAAALQAGETDWWEYAAADLLPLLRRNDKLVTRVQDPAGQAGLLRMNWLQPPFDNPAIRRVVLNAVIQSDFMTAMLGDDRTLWHDKQGVFTLGTPLANDAGMSALTAPARRRQAEAGPDRGRLQGRDGGADRADRFPEPEGAVRCGRRHAAQDRYERRLPGHRLGHRADPARQDGSRVRRRLEHVLHLQLRQRPGNPRRLSDDARPGQRLLVWLADRSRAGKAA